MSTKNNPFSVDLSRFRNVELDDLDWDEIEQFDLERGDREYKRYAERERERERDSEYSNKEKDNANE